MFGDFIVSCVNLKVDFIFKAIIKIDLVKLFNHYLKNPLPTKRLKGLRGLTFGEATAQTLRTTTLKG